MAYGRTRHRKTPHNWISTAQSVRLGTSPKDLRRSLHWHPAYAATQARAPAPDGLDAWIQASKLQDNRGMQARLRR